MFGGVLRPLAAPFRVFDKPVGEVAVQSIPSVTLGGVNPSCNKNITPTCLLELYNATNYKVQAAQKGNKIAIASNLGTSFGSFLQISFKLGNSTQGQFANIVDLEQFYETLRPEAVNSSFAVVSVDGDK